MTRCPSRSGGRSVAPTTARCRASARPGFCLDMPHSPLQKAVQSFRAAGDETHGTFPFGRNICGSQGVWARSSLPGTTRRTATAKWVPHARGRALGQPALIGRCSRPPTGASRAPREGPATTRRFAARGVDQPARKRKRRLRMPRNDDRHLGRPQGRPNSRHRQPFAVLPIDRSAMQPWAVPARMLASL
jgi:hypothetical protein